MQRHSSRKVRGKVFSVSFSEAFTLQQTKWHSWRLSLKDARVRLPGSLAQLAEQGPLKPKVVGSIPTRPTSPIVTQTISHKPMRVCLYVCKGCGHTTTGFLLGKLLPHPRSARRASFRTAPQPSPLHGYERGNGQKQFCTSDGEGRVHTRHSRAGHAFLFSA